MVVRPAARRKLAALVAAGSLALVVFGVDLGHGAAGHGRAHRRAAGHTTATGAALEADMMHDAVRRDVLRRCSAARAASTTPRSPTCATTPPRCRRRWRRWATGLGSDVDDAVTGVADEVERLPHVGAADRRPGRAGPRHATAAYPSFRTAFESLEEALPVVGDAVGAKAAAAAQASEDQRRLGDHLGRRGRRWPGCCCSRAGLGGHPVRGPAAAAGPRRRPRPGRRRPARHDGVTSTRRGRGRSRPRWRASMATSAAS